MRWWCNGGRNRGAWRPTGDGLRRDISPIGGPGMPRGQKPRVMVDQVRPVETMTAGVASGRRSQRSMKTSVGYIGMDDARHHAEQTRRPGGGWPSAWRRRALNATPVHLPRSWESGALSVDKRITATKENQQAINALSPSSSLTQSPRTSSADLRRFEAAGLKSWRPAYYLSRPGSQNSSTQCLKERPFLGPGGLLIPAQ